MVQRPLVQRPVDAALQAEPTSLGMFENMLHVNAT